MSKLPPRESAQPPCSAGRVRRNAASFASSALSISSRKCISSTNSAGIVQSASSSNSQWPEGCCRASNASRALTIARSSAEPPTACAKPSFPVTGSTDIAQALLHFMLLVHVIPLARQRPAQGAHLGRSARLGRLDQRQAAGGVGEQPPQQPVAACRGVTQRTHHHHRAP